MWLDYQLCYSILHGLLHVEQHEQSTAPDEYRVARQQQCISTDQMQLDCVQHYLFTTTVAQTTAAYSSQNQ